MADVTLVLTGDRIQFVGTTSYGDPVLVGGDREGPGAKPSDLLPLSLAACTAYDVVEVLRKGILEPDKAKLAQVTSEQLSYGHSSGRVETKEQFINGVMTRKAVVKSLAFPELKVTVVGNAAIARHIYLAESELDGKATTTRIGALQVWQKQDGAWKLLARQGFQLPA